MRLSRLPLHTLRPLVPPPPFFIKSIKKTLIFYTGAKNKQSPYLIITT